MPRDTQTSTLPPYVLQRGSTLHYRRRVPKGAESKFGGRGEFVRTLKARNLREAQSELANVLMEYERLLAGNVDEATPGTDPVLNQDVAERLARKHLKLMRAVNAGNLAYITGAEAGSWTQLHRRSAFEDRKALALGTLPEHWVMSARALVRDAGHDPENHADFVLIVARTVGELHAEYAMQMAYELEGEVGRKANERVFGDAAYAADAKVAEMVSVAEAAKRFLANPMKEIAASTLQQYRPRMTVIKEALGASRAVTDLTRTDCRQVVEEVILRLPSNVRKKYPGLSLGDAIARGAKEGKPVINLKTQRLP